MNNPPPPPPPPHGENPKTSSGLPPGKYDIFIIPEHSAGSGFLYLPSLRTNPASFAAGFASALFCVALWQVLTPVVKAWWQGIRHSGGMGMVMVMLAIALGAWALGRMQTDNNGAGFGAGPGASNPPPTGSGPTPTGTGPPPPSQNGYAAGGSRFGGAPPPNTHGYQGNTGPPPGYTHSGFNQSAPPPGAEPPKPTWQRSNPTAGSSGAESSAKSAWERARQETKKREEERKKTEAEKKQREENERKLKEAREREAKERELREKLQREARERAEKELRAKIEREAREKIEREAREKLEREKKATSPEKPKGSTYAFSSMGERTNPWPNGGPPGSPDSKRPQAATARPYQANDEAYSARPYDKAKNPTHKKSHSSLYSESSYAASQTTAQTTPPPSRRGPYTTKDPDKIVVKAVYSFASAFGKTPTSQLVSGVGSVTDGLILRVTTEGLFIDDDVRGVPQREWDVKAWTLKLVETGHLKKDKSHHFHVLRAHLRDTEGKRYVFVLSDEEAWKVKIGLERLRKGSQVRQLSLSTMTSADARTTLESLGWA